MKRNYAKIQHFLHQDRYISTWPFPHPEKEIHDTCVDLSVTQKQTREEFLAKIYAKISEKKISSATLAKDGGEFAVTEIGKAKARQQAARILKDLEY